MAHKDKKKRKKQKHKKSSHKKEKKKQRESIEDVSSESSSDLDSTSSSDSSSESEGEENLQLTKAKAMLKFRETYQKRLIQRERAAGKSKTNVRELFDPSVPLDIDDLKAEFDNAPAPSLNSDDILRGGHATKGRKNQKANTDLSNVTIGKLPSKASLQMKSKPEKLVNQFFAKELVNPKPKASIKIGLISTKIELKKSHVAGPLPPGLEICPVTPPDGYSLRAAREEAAAAAELEAKGIKEGPPLPAEAKKSGPRIIHQVSVPDPEPTITEPMRSATQQHEQAQAEDESHDATTEDPNRGGPTAEEVQAGDVAASEASYTGPGPAPLPPANYCSAPAILKRDEQPQQLMEDYRSQQFTQYGPPQPPRGPPQHGPPQHGPPQHGPPQHGPPQHGPPQHGPPQHGPPQHGPPQHGPPHHGPPHHGPPQHGPPQPLRGAMQPQHGPPRGPPNGPPVPLGMPAPYRGHPTPLGRPALMHPARHVAPQGALAQQMQDHQQQQHQNHQQQLQYQQQRAYHPTQLQGPLSRFVPPRTQAPDQDTNAEHSEDNQNFPTSEPHKAPIYDPNKTAFDPNQPKKPPASHNVDPSRKQSEMETSKVPSFDPSKMPQGFDPSKMAPFDQSKLPHGFDPSKLPHGFDPSKLPHGFDPRGFDPSNLPHGFDPSKLLHVFDPSKVPPFDPSKMPPFDRSKMPPFDPSKLPHGFDPSKLPHGFDPSKMRPGFDPSKMRPAFDPSKIPYGFDPSRMPPGFDPSKMPPFDPSKMPPGFDPKKMRPPFPMHPGMRPPPEKRPKFDATRLPVHTMPGRPPFDPHRLGMPPVFPPHAPYPEHRSSSRHDTKHHESRSSYERSHETRSSSHDRHDGRKYHDSHRSSNHDSHRSSNHDSHRSSSYDRSYSDERRQSSPYKSDKQGSPYKHDRQSSPYDPNRKLFPPSLHNGHIPPPQISAAQWNHEPTKPEQEMKAKSPPTPEIDPRAVREALRFLQGTTDIDDDVVRRALMSIKSKQKTEKEHQKSYSAGPTQYNYTKPEYPSKPEEADEILPGEAEKIVQQVQEQQKLAQQLQNTIAEGEEAGEIVEDVPMPLVQEQLVPVLQPPPPQQAPGPEVPLSGLPEPDYTPAVDLDKSNWQITPSKETEEPTSGYTFPPEGLPASEYEYSDYYMHYYQQAYHMWAEEKEKPIEARYPVSQGYGHKRALEKGGAVKGSGRAILFNKEEIQALVLKRKKIAQEMVKDPSSPELMDKMEAVQHKLNSCGVTETEIAMMETSQMQSAWKKRRQEDSDSPAWTRPDMFFALPLVRSTVGMAILKKQGWTVGQVLGRGCPYGSAFGAGSLQPLELMVKTDQAGLLCAEERTALKAKKYGDVMPSVITEQLPAPRSTISGRHPCAALADVCHQRKWKMPEYSVVKEEGVAHKKLFYYEVSVKCGKFTTPNGAKNKRQAKSDAAAACLERLGLMTSLPPGYS